MVTTLYRWKHRPDWKMGASMGAKSQSSAATRGIAYHRRVYRQLSTSPHLSDGQLLIEPWFCRQDDQPQRTWRQPDAILLYPSESLALVIEVKMNWKDGRDEKLLTEYLPIVKSAFDLDIVSPLLITSCLRGYPHPPLLGLASIPEAFAWEPGLPTPLLLLP